MKKVAFEVIDSGTFLTYIYGGVYKNTNLLIQKTANEQRTMRRKNDLFTAKKRRLGTILTLRVYFAPTNFTLSAYLASKHFGDSTCFASVAKQFPKEADEIIVPLRLRTLRRRSGERSVAIKVLPENAGYSVVIGVTPKPNDARMRAV